MNKYDKGVYERENARWAMIALLFHLACGVQVSSKIWHSIFLGW